MQKNQYKTIRHILAFSMAMAIVFVLSGCSWFQSNDNTEQAEARPSTSASEKVEDQDAAINTSEEETSLSETVLSSSKEDSSASDASEAEGSDVDSSDLSDGSESSSEAAASTSELLNTSNASEEAQSTTTTKAIVPTTSNTRTSQTSTTSAATTASQVTSSSTKATTTAQTTLATSTTLSSTTSTSSSQTSTRSATTAPTTAKPSPTPSPSPTPTPTPTPVPTTKANTVDFTIYVEKSLVDNPSKIQNEVARNTVIAYNGVFRTRSAVPFQKGMTPLSVLESIARQENIPVTVDYQFLGAFVTSINYLEYRMAGGISGWTYYINGQQPQIAADQYTLEAGDLLEWIYIVGE